MQFSKYIGIDYSGAKTPTSRLSGLRVYQATVKGEPTQVETSAGDGTPAKNCRWNWSRKEIADWFVEQLAGPRPILVGIDHAFSFPDSYFQKYSLKNWDAFLDDFYKHWWTEGYLDEVRKGNPRTGPKDDLRLCEASSSSAKSVFQLDGQGTVGKSSHAGIPWLRFLRRHPKLQGKIHFWPFDGLEVPKGKSAIVEVYPAILKRRYPQGTRNSDEHDAYVVSRWLQEADANDNLSQYFNPPLINEKIYREGWILGIF